MKIRVSLILIWLVCCWAVSAPVWAADPYSKGLDAYYDEKYADAYKILRSAAKKAKSKSDKASAFALMGASSVKLGKNGKAKSLFTKAIKLDPSVSLEKDVLKDKSVSKIFAKVKKKIDKDELSLADDGDDDFDDFDDNDGSGGSRSGGVGLFLPFGIGFFLNGKTTRFTVYGGAQLVGLVGYLAYGNEINKANADAEAAGSELIANRVPDKPDDPIALIFLDDNEAYVKNAQSRQTAMIGLLAAGYGVSVLDALIFSGSSKNQKSSMNTQSGGHSMAASTKWLKSEAPDASNTWELNLLPAASKVGLGAVLSLDRKF